MAADAQADFPVDFEAAGRGEEAERRGTERVRGRQHDAAMVDAILEGRGGRAAEGEVPVEEV